MYPTAELDIRTLLLVLALVGLLMALTMAVFARRFPHYEGTGWVAAADAMIALGMYLVSMRDEWSEPVSGVLANIVTLIGFLLNYEGLRRLLPGTLSSRWAPHWLLLVLVPGAGYFSFVEPNIAWRIALFSGCAGIAAGLTARMLFVSPASERLPDLRPVAWVFAGFAALLLVRALYSLAQAPIEDFMQADSIHAGALASYIVFLILKDVGLLQACVSQLIADSERQARTDPLTSLMNRRAVLEQGERAFQRSRSGAAALSAIMADLDHFKRVNDEHGHQAGDAVLAGVATILQRSVRPGDLCARFGGEEFLLLLPETTLDEAQQLAERLRAKVEQTSPEHCNGIACTASFGVAALGHETRLEQLISRADRAMYAAKHGGRNRVEVDAEERADASQPHASPTGATEQDAS